MSGSDRTPRGRSGKKWVGLNYQEKEIAKDANAGTMPYTLSLVTSDFPHKAEWSEVDLPDILFYIQPPTSKYEGGKIDNLLENGEPVASDAPDGHNIRQFDVLPRNISLDVPGWLIEAWRRLDPRIGYQDILDRQYADPDLGFKKHTKNALQNHCRRECRKVLNTWVAYGRRDEPHRTEVESIEGLSSENVKLNTILQRSLVFPNRLVKVRLERKVEDGLYYAVPREVTIGNWLESTLPLDHFLLDSQPHDMTKEMHAAFEMYLILMERAAVHGYDHWTKLGRSCLPVTWFDRTRTKSEPNDTYDEGCEKCTWSSKRKDLAGPDIKFEEDDVPLTTKASKRRRSGSRAEMGDIGDTLKTPKRRYTTRLSSRSQGSISGGTDCESGPTVKGVTYVETYRRRPDEYEYYNDDSEEDSPSDEDADDNGSEHDSNEEDEAGVLDEMTSSPNIKSDPSSPNQEEAGRRAGHVAARDLFRTPSTTRTKRRSSNRKVEVAAGGSPSPSQHNSQPGPWLPQDIDYSPNSSTERATVMPTDLNELPGYLPASAFSSHHSSFTSIATQPRTSFSSNDAGLSTLASSFTEASGGVTGNRYVLPTAISTGFPSAQLYPLPVTQAQAASGTISYPSPPHTAVYQNQMSFMSSPPRRSAPESAWNPDRPRRRSDTDAPFGLPGDFAQLGAFTYGLATDSSYVGDEEFSDAPELPLIAPDDEYTNSHNFEDEAFEIAETADLENVEGVEDMTTIGTIRSEYDIELFEDQPNVTTASLSVL